MLINCLMIILFQFYEIAGKIASKMTYFDLMSNNKYMEEYVSENFLSHTAIEKFPSVAEELRVRS